MVIYSIILFLVMVYRPTGLVGKKDKEGKYFKGLRKEDFQHVSAKGN